MNTVATMYKLLHDFTARSKYGLKFNCFRSSSSSVLSITLYWPRSAEFISFDVREVDVYKDPLKVLEPYFEKAFEHEQIMDSPLMKALR